MRLITVFNRSLLSLSQYTNAVFYDVLLAVFKITPLLNLRLIILGLTLLGWCISNYLSFFYDIFLFTPAFCRNTTSPNHTAPTSSGVVKVI